METEAYFSREFLDKAHPDALSFSLDAVAAKVSLSMHQQVDQFVSLHLGKVKTHNLVYFPQTQEREGDYLVFKQMVALVENQLVDTNQTMTSGKVNGIVGFAAVSVKVA